MLTIFENIFLCILMGGLCLMAAIGFLFLLAISVWMIIKYFKEEKK